MFAAGFIFSVLSWFGFYAASPKRAQHVWIDKLPARRLVMRGAALAFAVLALLPFARSIGLERGIAIWLGVFMFAGIVFAFSVQTHSALHRAGLWVCACAAPLCFAYSVLG